MTIVYRALYQCAKLWWRVRRPLTMGVRILVINTDNQVLLVRHGYLPGWYLPGGGVERGETAGAAATRELREEAGLLAREEDLVLRGLFANFSEFKNDHIALFQARQWVSGTATASAVEIVETKFFPLTALPADITAGTRRRILEVGEGTPRAAIW